MPRHSLFALLLGLAACAEPAIIGSVNGGDELSPLVGEPAATASTRIARAGYRPVAETSDGASYWLNARTGACARTRSSRGILLTVVQLPRTACQTVSR